MPRPLYHGDQDRSIGHIISYLKQVEAIYNGNQVRGKWVGAHATLTSPPAFILKHAQRYYFDNMTYKGRRGQKHACFMNASKLALDDAELTYVEGYVELLGIAIEHAWVVTSTRRVIDPTLAYGQVGGYYGIPFTREYVQTCLLENEVWGLLGDYSIKSKQRLLLGTEPLNWLQT